MRNYFFEIINCKNAWALYHFWFNCCYSWVGIKVLFMKYLVHFHSSNILCCVKKFFNRHELKDNYRYVSKKLYPFSLFSENFLNCHSNVLKLIDRELVPNLLFHFEIWYEIDIYFTGNENSFVLNSIEREIFSLR
jgi:hypothetical protein